MLSPKQNLATIALTAALASTIQAPANAAADNYGPQSLTATSTATTTSTKPIEDVRDTLYQNYYNYVIENLEPFEGLTPEEETVLIEERVLEIQEEKLAAAQARKQARIAALKAARVEAKKEARAEKREQARKEAKQKAIAQARKDAKKKAREKALKQSRLETELTQAAQNESQTPSTANAQSNTTHQGIMGVDIVDTRTGTPERNRLRGYRIMKRWGWKDRQWKFLDSLWTRESGWNQYADNPNSTAYGIPQALVVLHDLHETRYMHKPRAQIRWGLSYIRDRYQTPKKAWLHSEENNWY